MSAWIIAWISLIALGKAHAGAAEALKSPKEKELIQAMWEACDKDFKPEQGYFMMLEKQKGKPHNVVIYVRYMSDADLDLIREGVKLCESKLLHLSKTLGTTKPNILKDIQLAETLVPKKLRPEDSKFRHIDEVK